MTCDTGPQSQPRGLELHGVSVHYPGGEQPAVSQVDLQLAPGRILALLGPSGCGKSSLLRAIAGLEQPSAGGITWAGQQLAHVPVHRRDFGLMFQEGQLFPHQSVAGNIEFGLRMARWNRADRRRRVSDLLDVVGLAGYGARAVSTLSGGQRQRVALARAVAPAPKLLLLDEPLSSLDRALREHLTLELAEILRHTGTTALYVTHDHEEAFTVADRVGLMDEGRLLQVDTPAQLWRYPADVQLARFLGFTIAAVGGEHWALPPATAQVRSSAMEADVAGRDIPTQLVGTHPGTVTGTSFSQGAAIAHVQVPPWGVLSARVDGDADTIAPGDRITVTIDPAAVVPVPARATSTHRTDMDAASGSW